MDDTNKVFIGIILFLSIYTSLLLTVHFLVTEADPCDVNRDGRVTLTDMEIVKERLLELQGEWD